MLKLKKVAVTGGLSSGKTAVCNFFKQLNAYVVSADEIVHQLLSLQTPVCKQIVSVLGDDVVINGAIDRKKIAHKVFNNQRLLKKLEECLYPAVFEKIERHYQEAKPLNPPLFIAEIPKLFESGMEIWFDVVITISTDEALSLKRYEKQGGTKKEYDQRMSNQMPVKQKMAHSNYIIYNNGELDLLKSSVVEIFHLLTQEELPPK